VIPGDVTSGIRSRRRGGAPEYGLELSPFDEQGTYDAVVFAVAIADGAGARLVRAGDPVLIDVKAPSPRGTCRRRSILKL